MNEGKENLQRETIQKKKKKEQVHEQNHKNKQQSGEFQGGKAHRSDSQESVSNGNGFSRRNSTMHFTEEPERIDPEKGECFGQ